MSKKLAAKASMIQMPPALAPGGGGVARDLRDAAGAGEGRDTRPVGEGTTGTATGAPEMRVKTAPGSMAHFMAAQSSAVKEADELRERLKSFDGASPVRQIDPRLVRASRWANRHEHAYADAAFDELKTEIASAGGNVQPASVRRLPADPAGMLNGPTPGVGTPLYEIVFGHRRHRACLELGLPLQAMVVEASDRELFEAMERENRSRKNLSAWEQGGMYKRALDEGLYPSQRKLAEALSVDVSLVSKSLSLSRLPDAVVQAFPSPLEIQFRWAQPLAEALQRDPDAMLARAARIRQQGSPTVASLVFAALTARGGVEMLNRSTPPPQVMRGRAGRQATLSRDTQGGLLLRFAPGALDAAGQAALVACVETLLADPEDSHVTTDVRDAVRPAATDARAGRRRNPVA